jgi:hypothetical protein
MHMLTGQWVPKPMPTAGRGRAAPVVASVRRSASRFHKLEYTSRQPRVPHSCAKRDPRAPVRIACINVSAMPSLGKAPRRHLAAGLRPICSMGRIAKFAAKMRMERAPERIRIEQRVAADLGGGGALVTGRGLRPARDHSPR